MIEWPATHPSGCMQRMITKDDSLGTVRNHASEKISLHEAIANYTAALAALDFKYCPENFTSAFKTHRLAWDSLIPVVQKYEHKRGEMHNLFKMLEQSEDSTLFKQKLKLVWDTWADVEKATQ